MLGPLVFCLLSWSIYRQIQRQPNWQQSFSQIRDSIITAGIWKPAFVCVLMFYNWGLEARKWQLVISRVQPISFLRSFMATFTGTTLAFFTPNRMGEYFGRILYINEGKRLQAISLTIVSSIAQLLVTLWGGVIGVIFLRSYIAAHEPESGSILLWMNIILGLGLGGAAISTLFYFRLSWLVRAIEKIPRITKYIKFIRVLEGFKATILLRILSLSLARYTVFIVQYYLLFEVFSVDISWWQAFWAVSVMFLVLAMAPTVAFLTELGVRAKASMELVQLFSTNVVGILATSLSIWIINLVIPALIGSLLILGVKIRNSGLKYNR